MTKQEAEQLLRNVASRLNIPLEEHKRLQEAITVLANGKLQEQPIKQGKDN